MYLQSILLSALAGLGIVFSLPVNQTVQPVNLAHLCIRVETVGGKFTSDRSPVLLLHGLGGSRLNWDGVQQLISLGTHREVCAVDLRNHGDSPWSTESDINAITADIDHFLQKRNIEKVNIIGHSLGGKIGCHYALKYPNKVESLVVEDMRPNGMTPNALNFVKGFVDLLDKLIETIPGELDEDQAKKSMVDVINKKLEELGFPDRLDLRSASNFEIQKVDGKWQWKMNIKFVKEALNHIDAMLPDSTGLYEGPALFIYGGKSPFKVGEDKENILKLFPKAQFILVPQAGHLIHGKFRKFDDAVIKFLQ